MAEHTQPIQIDAAILQQYVDALGSIGWQADGGIIRPVYSAAWMHARGQVADWMRAAGLEVRGDAVGNLFGRLRGEDESRTILTGSHLDTVPLGGKFDGALGILAGLVALRSLQEIARHLPTAMLFVPSVEGRSHSAAEYTMPEDAARGATVLATALNQLAY